MRFFFIVVLAVTIFQACTGSSSATTPTQMTEPNFSAYLQSLIEKDVVHKRFLRTLESTGNDVEDRMNFVPDIGAYTKLKLHTYKLGRNFEAALKSSTVGETWKLVNDINKSKLPEKQISVIGTFIRKYGNDAVIKALANAKQADDTSDVVKKLETELFTRWMKNRQLPESVFLTLKIQNEEDIVVHMGKIALVDDYITFLNGKVDQKESLLKVLTKGFGDQKKALSVLADARKNSLTTKRATELETKLLLEKSSDQIALTGGLDALGKNLAQLDGYVTNLKTTYTNNDVSILKALLVKYDDATVANALEKAKSVEGAKGIATKIQNEQFQIWLKEGNLIEGVYKLLKLNEYGDKIMTSRAIGVLESYTAFFNREMDVTESFIKIVSKQFGGDSKFAIKLQGFKGVEDTSGKATKLQNQLFQQWKSKGVTEENVIDKIFKVKEPNKDMQRTADEFNIFLKNAA